MNLVFIKRGFLTRQPFRKMLAGLALSALAGNVAADPGYYLIVPYSQAGVTALDFRYWTVKPKGESATLWPELGVRYGVSSRWTSELFASYIGDSLHDLYLSSLNWQNDYLLTQGEYPFDLAIHAQLIRKYQEGNELELGPVFQTEWGFTQLNFNVIFDHDWSANKPTQLKYQWQVMRRLQPGLRVGVQGFGEIGTWNHWSDNPSHRAGPVMRLNLFDRADITLAYLWGKTYGSKAGMFSAQLLIPF